MKMLDLVRTGHFFIRHDLPAIIHARKYQIQQDAMDATAIDIQNVINFYDAGHSQTVRKRALQQPGCSYAELFGLDSFTMPFENVWFEGEFTITKCDPTDPDRKTERNAIQITQPPDWRNDGRFGISIWTFVPHMNSKPLLWIRGQVENDDSFSLLKGKPEHQALVDEVFFQRMNIAMTALAFMMCKNVTTKYRPNVPKLQRRFHKQYGIPQVSYKTIVIEPIVGQVNHAGGVGTIGLERAMHIVRGNFATYSPEKPLFGKVSGRFFRQAHLSGSDTSRMNVNNYQVGKVK